jgi:phosphonate metabolism-associated iron-containing alcohol dehydrogenase
VKFYNPVRVESGGADLAEIATLIGARRAAVVTTRGMERRGTAETLRCACRTAELHVFADIGPNPTIASVSEGAAVALQADPEVIVALGGGSALDSAKGIAALSSPGFPGGGWLSKHLREGAPFPADFRPLPIIAIPTTAGTGSEVTRWGTIWDENDGSKYSISHEKLFPEAALLVPELTLSVPPDITLFTGLDAISHCMESIWNRGASAVSDAFAVAGLRKMLDAMDAVLERPGGLQGRRAAQQGALLGGFAISCNATALAHSMSYPLTAAFGMPHGLACGFTLPELMRFNGQTAPDRVGMIVDVLGESDILTAALRLEKLFRKWDVSGHVRRYLNGDKATRLAQLKERLLAPGRASNNVRPATTDDALGIIRRSLGQK